MAELIYLEMKKALKLVYVKYALLGLFALAALCFFAQVCLPQLNNGFSSESYRQLVSDIDKNKPVSEEERLREVYTDMLLEGAEPEKMYASSLRGELYLYEQILGELSQAAGYKDYVDGVLLASKRYASVSIFSSSEAEKRNAIKTAADFEKMEDVNVVFGGTYGVNLLLDTDLWTVMLVFVLLILTAGLLLGDLENGGIKLLRCSVYGKTPVIYGKFFAGAVLSFLFMTISFLWRLLLIGVTYGFASWGEAIQSVHGAAGCTLKISIWGGVGVFFIYKLMGLFTIYSLFFMLTLFFRRGGGLFLVGIGIMLWGYGAYSYIDAASWMAKLKWLNPTAFLFSDHLLIQYRNISLFGYPISYWHIFTGVCVATTFLSLGVMGVVFRNVRPIGKGIIPSGLYGRIESIVRLVTGGYTLTGYECRKWSFYGGGSCLCLIFAIGIIFIKPSISERLYTNEEIYYKHYIKELEGDFSEEKLNYLYDEQKRLAELESMLFMEGMEYTDAAYTYYSRELNKKDGLCAAVSYGEYLKNNDGSFVYDQGYEMLLGKNSGRGYLLAYRTAALLVTVLLSGMVWGIEERTGMGALISISAQGRRRIRRAKYRNILFLGAFVAFITYLPWIYRVTNVFGTEMIHASASSMRMLSGIPQKISIFGVLIAFYLLHMVYLWLTGAAINCVFSRTKNMLLSELMVFGLGMTPVFLLAI